MEREGREVEREGGEGMEKREGRGRRRGGVEMRKGIVIGGMVIGLLLGCNNGIADELAAQKRLGEIGRSAENVFYSFIDLIAGTLGFTVKADTNKSAVGDYFTGLANGVEKAIQSLVEIGNKMQEPSGNEQKSGSVELSNQEIEKAKNTLTTLKGYIEALKDMGDSGKVVDGADSQEGASNEEELKKAYNALKGIVGIAKAQQVEALKENNVATEAVQIGVASPENGAKVLTTGAAGAPAGPGAVAIVSAVNGEAMLDAIVNKSKEDDVRTGVASGQASGSTSALAFAKGHGTHTNIGHATAKASSVAGGIALRLLTKSGKLASHGSNDGKSVQSAGITAVNKLLETVEDLIKKTVKKVIEKAKGEIDKEKEKAPKAVGQK